MTRALDVRKTIKKSIKTLIVRLK